MEEVILIFEHQVINHDYQSQSNISRLLIVETIPMWLVSRLQGSQSWIRYSDPSDL